MPDPGFRNPISNSSDVQGPVEPFNTVFFPLTANLNSDVKGPVRLNKVSQSKSAKSHAVLNVKPNHNTIHNFKQWVEKNTKNKKSIITRTKNVNLEKYTHLALIKFSLGNPKEELRYQNKLQSLDLAPKVVAVISDDNKKYELADILKYNIPITSTTVFYYEAGICGKNIFDTDTFGSYSTIFDECKSFFYEIADKAKIILSDMKSDNLCRDAISGQLRAIDFEPRFIVNIRSLKDEGIKKSYVIFMLFQLYISLIFHDSLVIQFAETNITVLDFNKMLEDLIDIAQLDYDTKIYKPNFYKPSPCLRNLYHYLGLHTDEYKIMLTKTKDVAMSYTKAYIRRQILTHTPRDSIDISFLDDTVTTPGGNRQTKRRFTRKQQTKKRRSAK
jgi:hypothetical protein